MRAANEPISPPSASVALVQTTLTPAPKRQRSSSGATSTGALRRLTIDCLRPTLSAQYTWPSFASESHSSMPPRIARSRARCSSSSSRSRPSSSAVGGLCDAFLQCGERARAGGARPRPARGRGRSAALQAGSPRGDRRTGRRRRAPSATLSPNSGVPALPHDPAPRPRVVEVPERPLDAQAAQGEAEVLLGDLRHGLRLVEDDEVPGEQDARGVAAGALGPGAARADQREEQRVVDDDDLGRAHPGAGALVEAALAVAVAPRARRRVRVHRRPRRRGRAAAGARGAGRSASSPPSPLSAGARRSRRRQRGSPAPRGRARASRCRGSSTCRRGPWTRIRRTRRGRARS